MVDKRTRLADWGKSRWQGLLEMNGKTLGIIGVGNVGRRVAKTAAALGMRVIAYDKYVPADEQRNRGVEPVADLPRSSARPTWSPATPRTPTRRTT